MKFSVFIAVFCAVLFVVCADVVSDDTATPPPLTYNQYITLHRHIDECKKEEQRTLNEEEENELWMFNYNYPNASENFKCLIRSIYKKIGFFDDNGNPDKNRIMEIYEGVVRDEDSSFYWEQCSPQFKGNTQCDKAVNFITCYLKSGAPFMV